MTQSINLKEILCLSFLSNLPPSLSIPLLFCFQVKSDKKMRALTESRMNQIDQALKKFSRSDSVNSNQLSKSLKKVCSTSFQAHYCHGVCKMQLFKISFCLFLGNLGDKKNFTLHERLSKFRSSGGQAHLQHCFEQRADVCKG